MATLTIRLSDEKHERLRQLAERKKISMNKLIDELSTIALADFDTETRFRARVAIGSPEEGLALLDLLDQGGRAQKSSGT
jgi:predicted transcriptional regulator